MHVFAFVTCAVHVQVFGLCMCCGSHSTGSQTKLPSSRGEPRGAGTEGIHCRGFHSPHGRSAWGTHPFSQSTMETVLFSWDLIDELCHGTPSTRSDCSDLWTLGGVVCFGPKHGLHRWEKHRFRCASGTARTRPEDGFALRPRRWAWPERPEGPCCSNWQNKGDLPGVTRQGAELGGEVPRSHIHSLDGTKHHPVL